MPAAGSLAALMREWPLNNVMLTTTTYSKLREVLDGTDTQVATCAIDRWTAKMKRMEGYITRDFSRRRTAIRKTQGSSIGGVSEEEEKKKSSSILDKPWPSPQPRCRWSDSPTIPLDREGVLTKAQFSSLLLYQIHCIGPVGFGFAHIYSERSLPNRDPTFCILKG